MHYIEVKKLGFSWDNEPVLNDISFTVDQGEFVILTGENGAAKSTLLRNILGLLSPDQGSATISKTNTSGQKLQIGYVPQTLNSFNAGFPKSVV